MSTTGLSNTWDLFPNRTLGRVGKRERGRGGNEQSNLFFFPLSGIFGCFSSDVCAANPLHSCRGFELLIEGGKQRGSLIERGPPPQMSFALFLHLNCRNSVIWQPPEIYVQAQCCLMDSIRADMKKTTARTFSLTNCPMRSATGTTIHIKVLHLWLLLSKLLYVSIQGND